MVSFTGVGLYSGIDFSQESATPLVWFLLRDPDRLRHMGGYKGLLIPFFRCSTSFRFLGI